MFVNIFQVTSLKRKTSYCYMYLYIHHFEDLTIHTLQIYQRVLEKKLQSNKKS